MFDYGASLLTACAACCMHVMYVFWIVVILLFIIRYFTWHTALLGSLINLVILFLVSWVFALISLAAMVAIVLLLQFTGKSKDWGDVSQALVYHQVGWVGFGSVGLAGFLCLHALAPVLMYARGAFVPSPVD